MQDALFLRRCAVVLLVCLVSGLCVSELCVSGLWGQAPKGQPQAKPPKPKKPEFPPISKVTQGYEKREGFITLYVNTKKHEIFGQISRAQLKKPFLLATSIAGGLFAGWQWDDLMVYWERLDRKLVLVEPEIRHRASSGTLTDVVKRTYRDRIITSVPIVAQGPGGAVLIDLGSLFSRKANLFVGSLAQRVDTSLTKVIKAKVFPKNVEIELDLVKPGGSGHGSSHFGFGRMDSGHLAVHYSLSKIEPTKYKPALADDRIGYYVTAHKDFTKGAREDTRFVRYLNRWHLEKADPSLDMSPPKNPIVFYVERTVPIRYRRYVHEGILEWNKAFEKIGIVGAIVVRQQTKDNEFQDLDPEDVRYNFFRWITSEFSFAMGPSRVHPETGQILDADIIFDDSMIRNWLEDYSHLIANGPVRESHPALKRYFEEHPHRHPMRRWMSRDLRRDVTTEGRREPDQLAGQGAISPGDCGVNLSPEEPWSTAARKASLCEFGPGVRHQVNLGLLALGFPPDEAKQPESADKKNPWPEDFLGEVLKEVVMHEVGHTLGLRHNFKASSWLPLAEINNSKDLPAATSGSVMDYNPIQVSLEDTNTKKRNWVTRTLGPYDYWAIEYGYTLNRKPDNLTKITSRVAEKGLAYGTDEDMWGSDPLVNAFDAGEDPLQFARERMELVRRMVADLVTRVARPGKGYQGVRRAFDMLLFDYARSAWLASKFVGGHHSHRDHKGDPNERPPIQPVPVTKQREALEFVCDYMFSEDAFNFPPEVLNYLAAGRWMHWGSADPYQRVEYPVHDRILQLQLWTLFDFLNPTTLTLLYDTEKRLPPDTDTITLPELFSKLTAAICGELKSEPSEKFTNRKPFISSVRRNLQHEYVSQLVDLALEGNYGWSPQAARTQAWYRLQDLRTDIDDVLRANRSSEGFQLDDYSQAHLEEASERIGRALEATYSRR